MRVFKKHLILNVNLAQNHGTFKGNFPSVSAALSEMIEKRAERAKRFRKKRESRQRTVKMHDKFEEKRNMDCKICAKWGEILNIIDNF